MISTTEMLLLGLVPAAVFVAFWALLWGVKRLVEVKIDDWRKEKERCQKGR